MEGNASASGSSSLCGGTFWLTLKTSMKKLVSLGFNRRVSVKRSRASVSWPQLRCHECTT